MHFDLDFDNKIFTARVKAVKPRLSPALKKPRPEAKPSQGQALDSGLGSARGF
jgi:hypothetical protein